MVFRAAEIHPLSRAVVRNEDVARAGHRLGLGLGTGWGFGLGSASDAGFG